MADDHNPPAAGAEEDGFDLEDFMKQNNEQAESGVDFLGDIASRELDVGEKHEDAIDFADISDDELPEEESAGEGYGDGGGDGLDDDLFGDGNFDIDNDKPTYDPLFDDEPDMAPAHDQQDRPLQSVEDQSGAQQTTAGSATQNNGPVTLRNPVHVAAPPEKEELEPDLAEQMALFEAARLGKGNDEFVVPKATPEEFAKVWPNFDPDKPPRFFSLVPQKRAYYIPKMPQKQPKLMPMVKVSLDIAADQEKSFRLPPAPAPAKAGRQSDEDHGGIVFIMNAVQEEREESEQIELDNIDSIEDDEKIGNVSWSDLKIACEDWDLTSDTTLSDDDTMMTPPHTGVDGLDMDWIGGPVSKKKRKLRSPDGPLQFSVYDHVDLPAWDDPELETARISKKIILDMNDPHLLLDVQLPSAEPPKPRTIGLSLKRDNRGSLANPMFKRYNISNDEAYDALKESSQQKVRSMIGHMNVEHSLPALKLQFPFYKVALSDRELRSFHRPTVTFKVGERVGFSQLKSVKRKVKKNLKPSEAFASAEDLNIGDNSDLLLAEYCEEYPTTLSNFGMGNKILNYYRRKDDNDTARPKREDGIGETSVLLPQDKSPFSLFGQVEPGQEVLTIHNAMYRAPVFKHNPEATDFLVSRSHTGVNGSKYYMRNIPNLMVIGQQFPSVEVPGTHARKVTEASKKRLKMLAFRLYRKGQQKAGRQPWVSNEMIKQHLPGTEIAQNRSRMREIMKYQKDIGTWEPMPGETIPEEPILRTWIKPEDVCLIDSMHAGDKQLQDAGVKQNEIRDDDDEQEGEESKSKLAPWNTTKNFLNACTGKAMLELHGEGDPTGQGLGFSFIKTSMKGGFRDIGESITDRVDKLNKKDNNGHSYNVQRQQQVYENAIKRIWNKQKETLSNENPPSDIEDDVDSSTVARGQRDLGTPALHRADDDTMSQFSRNSGADSRGKKLRITRTIKNKFDEYEERVEIVTDPEVIKLYLKKKKQDRLLNMKLDDIKPTGDAEYDKQQLLKLRAEMARLQRNMERREGREKAKGIHKSQNGEPGVVKGTPRKCAGCGEVGHIKTNKKLCPLLNGSRKQNDTFSAAAAASPAMVPATPSAMSPTG